VSEAHRPHAPHQTIQDLESALSRSRRLLRRRRRRRGHQFNGTEFVVTAANPTLSLDVRQVLMDRRERAVTEVLGDLLEGRRELMLGDELTDEGDYLRLSLRERTERPVAAAVTRLARSVARQNVIAEYHAAMTDEYGRRSRTTDETAPFAVLVVGLPAE